MKKIISICVSLVALVTMLVSGSLIASAATTTYTVSSVSEIQSKLDEAKSNATSSNPYKIKVKSGSYTLSTSLNIYSNTYLDVSGVTFKQTSGAEANMLKIGDGYDSKTGYYYENITISGGTWDENGNGNTAIKFAHAKNVTIENATLQNCKNGHLMEVGGVNGLTVENCKFKDQVLTVKEKVSEDHDDAALTYEAIQLDILEENHMSGYAFEDLTNKNITINNCTFDTVPRGVGIHTGVLNNPMNTISITNNTFKNITSAPIQIMDAKNVTISGNKMTDVPRGITIYSYQTSGTFLGSTLASEGTVSTSTSSKYTTPSNSNIVISDNTITVSGSDKYATYENSGIYIIGATLSKDGTNSLGGKVPKGDYYLTGVTITGNKITTKGYGIRLVNVRKAKINSNTVKYNGSSGSTYYGVSIRDNSQASSINSNTITSFYRDIFILDSKATDIKSNTCDSAKNNGISLENATVTTIKSNVVGSEKSKAAKNNGINIYSSSKVTDIISNKVKYVGKNGIHIEKAKVTGSIDSNTITSPGNIGIYVYTSGKANKINGNTIKSPTKYGIDIEKGSATKITNNTISKSKCEGIIVFNSATVENIKSNTIDTPSKNGILVQNAKVTGNIGSNKITSPKTNGIFVYKSANVAKMDGNTIKSAGKYGISVENATGSKITNNKISKAKNIGIIALKKGKVKEISGNTVSSGSNRGITISSLKCDLAINNNTISKCSCDIALYINPATTNYTVTANGNKITGTSNKKSIGIKVSSGKVSIGSNTVKSCKNGIELSTAAKGSIYGNTLSSNKNNKVAMGSKNYSFMKKMSLSSSTKTKTSIKLKWKKASGANGYEIWRSTSKNGTYKKVASVTSGTSYTDKKLTKNKKYYYKIVSYKNVKNYKIYSPYSSVLTVQTKK